MMVHELLYSLKKNKIGKVGKMIVKLDISKAYDRVEWPYLEAVMKVMGFTKAWIKLIMSCVSL